MATQEYPLGLFDKKHVVHPGGRVWVDGVGYPHFVDAGAGAEVVARFDGVEGAVLCRLLEIRTEKHRVFHLEGVRRVRVLHTIQRPASIGVQTKGYDHVRVELDEKTPVEASPPPTGLIELFAQVASLPGSWNQRVGPLDALSSIGKCASVASTMWMKDDERIKMFERPETIVGTIEKVLRQMIDSLSPERKRQAVSEQLSPKHTKNFRERTIVAEVEAATIVLGHPLDWVDVPDAFERDDVLSSCKPGTAAVWSTGGDLAFYLKCVGARSLSKREKARVTGSARFPLVVKHGRLFAGDPFRVLGKSSAQMHEDSDFRDANAWADVPNGSYECLVHALKAEDDQVNYIVQLLGTSKLPPMPQHVPDLDAWSSDIRTPLEPLSAKAKSTKQKALRTPKAARKSSPKKKAKQKK